MTGSMASDKEEPPAWRVFGNLFWALAWTSCTLWGSVARINWTFFTVSSASKDCKKSRVKDAKKNLWQWQEMFAPYLTGMPIECQKSSLEMASRPMLYANCTDRGFGVATGALVSRPLPTDVSEDAQYRHVHFFYLVMSKFLAPNHLGA